jgi:hypothetical protein
MIKSCYPWCLNVTGRGSKAPHIKWTCVTNYNSHTPFPENRPSTHKVRGRVDPGVGCDEENNYILTRSRIPTVQPMVTLVTHLPRGFIQNIQLTLISGGSWLGARWGCSPSMCNIYICVFLTANGNG